MKEEGPDSTSTVARTEARVDLEYGTAPYPYAATAIVLAAAMPLRVKIGFAVFGSFTLLDVVLVLATARVLFGSLMRSGTIELGDRRIMAALAVPLLVCIASLLWTQDTRATIRTTAMFAEAMVAYCVVVNVFAGFSANQLFVRASILMVLLLAGSLLSILNIPGFAPLIPDTMVLGGPEQIAYLTTYYARLGNPFYGLSNDFASVLALYVFPLLAWGVITRQSRYLLLAGIVFTGIILTFSRGVALATIAGGVILVLARRRESARWLPGLALGVVLLASIGYAYYAFNTAVQTHLIDRLSAATLDTRQAIMVRAIELVTEAPALGYGGGVIADPLLVDGVHNTYVQQMLYYGVPLGLLCGAALWLLAARFWFLRTQFHSVRIMATAIGVSVLVQLAAFLVETSFEATLPKTAFYFFTALGWLILVRMNADAKRLSAQAL